MVRSVSPVQQFLGRVCVVISCLLLQIAPVNGGQLHLVMALDVEDSKIGESVIIDLNNMSEEVQRISAFTGMEVVSHVLAGCSFSTKNVLNTLDSMEVAPDDMIFFYYSGHGYRVQSKRDQWPVMFFGWRGHCLDLGTVADVVASKNPRFALVVADCCNNYISEVAAPPYRHIGKKSGGDNLTEVDNYRRLFLESEGLYLVCSSSMGEYSYALEFGGLYTTTFLDVLQNEATNPDGADWEVIFHQVSERIDYLQSPLHTFIPRQPSYG